MTEANQRIQRNNKKYILLYSLIFILGSVLTISLMKWQDFIVGIKDREKTKDVKTEIHAQSSKPQNKELKIEGRLEEVSPNEQWILYQVPEEKGRWDGETYKGILKALYIPTGKIIEIMKSVRYDSNVHFFSDSQLAIPREGRIELYNLDTEQWG